MGKEILEKALSAYVEEEIPEKEKLRKEIRRSRERVILEDNLLLKMQEDIERALKKPLRERHWGMVLDLRKCIGCDACTIACKAENKTPPGVSYNVVLKEEIGTYPYVRKKFTPRPCMQC